MFKTIKVSEFKMGDIGEPQRHVTFEPMPETAPIKEPIPVETPVETPVTEPEKVPA